MNIDCRVIGDLLPLYADESCSDASRALVDDHLKTCPRCRETLARMKSEQFLPAAQAIDPPAVADYAQKVKHRRQKRGTLLTVGVIALIVLLSLTAAAWMNLVRAQHPYIPVVEESVCNLAAGEVQTFADSCDGRRLFTNSTRIAVTFRADTPQNGTITLWNITDVTKPYPAMFYEVDGCTARCEFTNLSSAERYFVLCDGLSGDVTLSDGRPTDLWESFLDLLHTVPEGRAVCKFRRSVCGQHDFRMDNAGFAGVVMGQAVPFIRQLGSAAVGGCGNSRPALAALDDTDGSMAKIHR